MYSLLHSFDVDLPWYKDWKRSPIKTWERSLRGPSVTERVGTQVKSEVDLTGKGWGEPEQVDGEVIVEKIFQKQRMGKSVPEDRYLDRE